MEYRQLPIPYQSSGGRQLALEGAEVVMIEEEGDVVCCLRQLLHQSLLSRQADAVRDVDGCCRAVNYRV